MQRLPWLFATTVFLSAGLLFLVEPMVAKMLLPLLGGAPSVWNTCLLFYQALLLAGYAYAHFLGKLPLPRQAAMHLSLVVLAVAVLPVHVGQRAIQALSNSPNPVAWELWTLSLTVGLPFFTLAATGPIVQHWFSQTGHRDAADPYFLYAASNAGSLLALLAYPAVAEPWLRLGEQSRLWTVGFALLGLLILACGLGAWRWVKGQSLAGSRAAEPRANPTSPPMPAVDWARRLRWLALAAVPSSLLLGVTTYLTTDVASVPLLWVVPLAVYLATFVLAFARRRFVPDWVSMRGLPIMALALVFLFLIGATSPLPLLVGLNLIFLFLAGMFCHGRLADDRPAAGRLTEFYLWIAAGGVLGGGFNALLAPLLFSTVIEYPLGIGLVCWLRVWGKPEPSKAFDQTAFNPPRTTASDSTTRSGGRIEAATRPAARWDARDSAGAWWEDGVWALTLGVLTAALAWWLVRQPLPSALRPVLIFGAPLVGAYLMAERPLRFALAVGAILLAGQTYPAPQGQVLKVERDFFGVTRVTLDASGRFHQIVHGNTLHGRQFIERKRRCEPLAYYHRSGPAGDLFEQLPRRATERHVGLVGLGAGSLFSFARPGEHWTAYEIDPAVVRTAQDTNCFGFLGECSAVRARIVEGDARLRLQAARPREYELLVIDAFSSDAIPVHLLTREALEVYRSKLAPGGALAFHISNRCLDLEPVLGDLAGAAGLICVSWNDESVRSGPEELGKEPSQWVVLARRAEDLGGLASARRWVRVLPRPKPVVWTDDFSNLLGAFRW